MPHDAHPFCASRDAYLLWTLVYDDVCQDDRLFYTEEEAMAAWEEASTNWTCTLIGPVRRRPPALEHEPDMARRVNAAPNAAELALECADQMIVNLRHNVGEAKRRRRAERQAAISTEA